MEQSKLAELIQHIENLRNTPAEPFGHKSGKHVVHYCGCHGSDADYLIAFNDGKNATLDAVLSIITSS